MAMVEMDIVETWPEGAAGLLIPFPPDTKTQSITAFDAPRDLRSRVLHAEAYPQKAIWVEKGELGDKFWRFSIGPGVAEADGLAYAPYRNRYTELPEHLKDGLEPLAREALSPDAKALALARKVFASMSYRNYSSDASGKDFIPSEVCGLKDGNCLDMNTAMLAMLFHLRIPAAYNIGWFFPDDQPREVQGWHCWISTWGREFLEWDISHRLLRGAAEASPGFDAFPGRRLAVSRGRGLVFRSGSIGVTLSHFGTPKWIHANGDCKPARFRASWKD